MWSGAGGGETSDNAPPGQQKSERSTVQHIASQLRKSSSDHLRPSNCTGGVTTRERIKYEVAAIR